MDKKFLVFLSANGSVVIADSRTSQIVSSTGLLLVFALGLSLNTLFAISFASTPPPRVAGHTYILHLTLAGALDSLNALVSLVLLLHQSSPRLALCHLSVLASQLTTVVFSWLVAALGVDRALRARNRPSLYLQRVFPVATWVISTLVVVAPVLSDPIIDASVFLDRYACGWLPTPGIHSYPWLLLVVGYAVPWAAIAVGVSVAARQATVATTSEDSDNAEEEKKSGVVFLVILFAYIFLLLPNIISVTVSQMTGSSTESNSNSSAAMEVTQTSTGQYDVVFTWARYNATLVIPLCLFVVLKEVRKKCEELFCCCCCMDNSVLHYDGPRPTNGVPTITRPGWQREGRVAHYGTPVLFATSEGIHLRLFDGDGDGDGVQTSNRRLWINSGKLSDDVNAQSGKYKCEFCDVATYTTTQSTEASTSAQLGETQTRIEDQIVEEEVIHPEVRGNNESSSVANQQTKKIVRFAKTMKTIPVDYGIVNETYN